MEPTANIDPEITPPVFEARCNCLFDDGYIAQESIEEIARKLNAIGIYFDSEVLLGTVSRLGNWVGGHVSVFEDKVVFAMNAMNARFQIDSSDLVIPTALISNPRLGRMLMVAKTVDCDVLGQSLRFRCFGAQNDRLLAALLRVSEQG